MAIWDDAITARDKLVLKACGYGRVRGLGKRPALMVIDMNYNWGGRPQRTGLGIDQAHQA